MQFFQRIVVPFVAACLLLFSIHVSAHQEKDTNAAENTQQQVNINEATTEELQTLKGIGKNKAQAIVNYRDNQGKFQSVEDLSKVKGINNKTVAALQEKNPNRIVVE
ncbi:MAG: competence protein ComEA [Gammaproteobacteria bacterium]|jgi:competence protein ComEA|nr:competence protein ComEA [Gammaproteobacteria bacterium]